MPQHTRGIFPAQPSSRNIHDDVEPPFSVGGEVLYVLDEGALASIGACAECGLTFLSAPSEDVCPLCGSDQVAPAGTLRESYSREVDLAGPASRRRPASAKRTWKGGSGRIA